MRRSGRTTRQIDEAIQTLFKYGVVYFPTIPVPDGERRDRHVRRYENYTECEVMDHAARFDNNAQQLLIDTFERRFSIEHGIILIKQSDSLLRIFKLPDDECR